MKVSTTTKPAIRIAFVESDPLRLIGLSTLLESERDLELIAAEQPETLERQDLNLVLLGDGPGRDLNSGLANLRTIRPDLPVVVIGPRTEDGAVFSAIACGAKGYVFEGAEVREIAQAIRTVKQGTIWAPRRVLAMFIEGSDSDRSRAIGKLYDPLTPREKEVLTMLVAGLSNKEIGAPLGIEERTVKAHIAKMMRKVGVPNRIALSVHAITNSLVSPPSA
jgi:DNA-binding NarL/FixJ family response regulator